MQSSTGNFAVLPPSFVPGNGQVSEYDAWVAPFIRDLDVIIPGIVFFFVLQHTIAFLGRTFVPRYRELIAAEQVDWCIRGVAAVNGILAQRSTYLWLSYLWNMPEGHTYDFWTPLPGYRESLALLNAYFIWDFLICNIYSWSWAYTLHAVFSGLGMYLVSFPCSALWSPYYAGVYEFSNIFYQGAHMVRLVSDPKSKFAKVCCMAGDSFFALWFFVIRLGGGLLTSGLWMYAMVNEMVDGRVHSYSACACMVALFTTVIALQVFWAGAVLTGVKNAISGKASQKLD